MATVPTTTPFTTAATGRGSFRPVTAATMTVVIATTFSDRRRLGSAVTPSQGRVAKTIEATIRTPSSGPQTHAQAAHRRVHHP